MRPWTVRVADVAVVTDSSSCLPAALVDSLGITLTAAYYDLGAGPVSELEFDGDLTRFFAELDASDTVATTAPATVDDFGAAFEPLLAQHDAVVAVLTSSGISESCSMARQAAARLAAGASGERVTVIDSAGTCGNLAVQAVAAARAAAAGADRAGVIEAVRRARHETRGWVLLDTLEYLRRGGRVRNTVAWVASALDLKPILTIESEVVPVERVRSRRRGVERLVELVRHHRAAAGADRWFVHHAGAPEDAQRLAERIGEMFDAEAEFVCEVGPVIATHWGPGALAVAGLSRAALDGEPG